MTVNSNENNDFGFSFGDDTSSVPAVDKSELLREMILPFLNNLKKNPDKDVIKWKGPDRVKMIDDFIEKMNNLVDG